MASYLSAIRHNRIIPVMEGNWNDISIWGRSNIKVTAYDSFIHPFATPYPVHGNERAVSRWVCTKGRLHRVPDGRQLEGTAEQSLSISLASPAQANHECSGDVLKKKSTAIAITCFWHNFLFYTVLNIIFVVVWSLQLQFENNRNGEKKIISDRANV